MGFLKGLADWLRSNVPLIGGTLADTVEWIESGIESWSRALWEAANKVSEFFQYLWITIREAGERLATLIQDWWWQLAYFFQNLFQPVYDFFAFVWNSFRSWVEYWVGRIAEAWNFIRSWIEPNIRWLIDEFNRFIRDPLGYIWNALQGIWAFVYERIRPILDQISARINEAVGGLQSGIDSLWRSLESSVSQLRAGLDSLGASLRNALNDLERRFDDFKRDASNWLSNISSELGRLVQDFASYVRTSIVIWEAAKSAALRRTAEDIARIMERPDVQAGLMGGEVAAWVANPGVGAAVTGTILGLEAWSTLVREVPVGVPIESDNPIVRELFGDREIEFEGEYVYTFGELLDQPPAVEYVWPDVRAGNYEPEVITRG